MSFITKAIRKIALSLQGIGSIYDSTHMTFPQLDVEKIKQKLKLKEEATERGVKNLPLPDSKTFDDVELRIISFINDQVRDASQSFDDHHRAFEDRINRLKSTGNIVQLEQIAGAAEADFERQAKQSKIQIHIAKKDAEESENYLKKFRENNNLDRPAIYPNNRFLQIAIIFLLLVVETGFNGYFFAKGSELGWVGGIATALIPSIFNVIIAFFLGYYAFRLLAHYKWSKNISGLLLAVFFSIIIFVMNLTVAHLRSATVFEEHAAQIALQNLFSTPWILDDIESWWLMAIGCLCSLIAAIDFWSMDDRYPTYGAISRNRRMKIDNYDYVTSFVFEGLEQTLGHKLAELNEVRSLIESKESEAATIYYHENKLSISFSKHLDHLESVGRILLSYYRNKNCEARSDNPPKYFLQEWNLDRKKMDIYENDIINKTNEFKQDPLQIDSTYNKCLHRIKGAHDRALKTCKTIDELSLGENKLELNQELENDSRI